MKYYRLCVYKTFQILKSHTGSPWLLLRSLPPPFPLLSVSDTLTSFAKAQPGELTVSCRKSDDIAAWRGAPGSVAAEKMALFQFVSLISQSWSGVEVKPMQITALSATRWGSWQVGVSFSASATIQADSCHITGFTTLSKLQRARLRRTVLILLKWQLWVWIWQQSSAQDGTFCKLFYIWPLLMIIFDCRLTSFVFVL